VSEVLGGAGVINGAQPCNVFWEVGASATLGTNSTFAGTVMAPTTITAKTGATGEPGGPPSPGSHLLTPREAEVLPLLQQGRSTAQIALALQVGVETIRTHARNIYRKLGVSSRRELATLPPRASLRDADRMTAPPAHRRTAPTRDRQRRPGALRN
jgi:DNA-binding CsgD family transcriptional regulator